MVEPIRDLPARVLGFRLTGKLERDEYHDTLMAAISDGEREQAAAWLAG